MRPFRSATILSALLALAFTSICFAASPDRITAPIAAAKAVRLSHGVPMAAKPKFDRGRVSPSLNLPYITLLTVPSPTQQKALTKLIADQQNPHSASYRKWLKPEEYADQFGLSPNDINKLTTWLKSQGFTIVRTARGRNWIAFSGTAGQVQNAFRTDIHTFEVDGETHFANTMPASIPAALSGIVTGFRGMNNFRPKSQAHRAQPGYTFPYNGGNYLFISPGDVAAIYDVNALYTAGIDGTGMTLAVMGQTGIYQSDLTNFRQNFGLSAINCTTSTDIITACNTSNFQYVLVNGTATTVYGDLAEADIDVEWSGATARNAQVIYVTATDSSGGGVWDSWYYAVDNDVAPIITMSYTTPCELAEASNTGTGEFTFTSDEAELAQANSEGITFMNSSGDSGAAECDYQTNIAVYGYAVAYPASSQYVTGVGGTSIPAISPNEYGATYWNLTNGTDGASALGYIPEQPWNDAQEFGLECAANPTSSFCQNYGITDWASAQTAVGISSGGGGVSNCTTIDANGVCTGGFPQPSWQAVNISAVNPSGLGQVNSTPTRLTPDVSLLASPNFPGYLICTQVNGSSGGGSSCDSPTTGISDMLTGCFAGTGPCTIYGGTSVSSPVFAGMVALLNQAVNGAGSPGLGNINPTLYTLAAANSTNKAFNPVTTDSSGAYSNGAWCSAGTPTSGVSGDPWPPALQCPSSGPSFIGFNAYDADSTTNYNLVTGLGSVDLNNLASAWPTTPLSATNITVVSSENPAVQGDSVTLTATVTTTGSNLPTGSVTFYNGSSVLGTGVLGAGGRQGTVGGSQVATFTTTTLPVGSDTITATYYGGDANNATSTSQPLTETVNSSFTLSAPTAPAPAPAGTATTSTFTVTPTGGTFSSAVTFSCNGLPDATVSCGFSPTQIASGTLGAQSITLTITTSGPNTSSSRSVIRRRADNRSPWLPLSLPLAGVVVAGFAGRKRSKYAMAAGLCAALLMAGLLIACGNSTPAISVSSVTGNPASLYPNYSSGGDTWKLQQSQLSATVTNDSSNAGVTWSASVGSIDSTGLYTAPTAAEGLPGSVTITATSVKDTTKSATGTLTLTPATVPGTYNITVTATQGSIANTTSNISLVVQ